VHGLVNVDFADVRTIMAEQGMALMGTGRSSGERRALEAMQAAISSPLLEDVSLDGATGLLVNITGGPNLSLREVDEAVSMAQSAADPDANIIFGSVVDESLGDEVRITVIATGFNHAAKVAAPGVSYGAPAPTLPPPPAPTRRASGTSQGALPNELASQITRELPTVPSRRQTAQIIEEPEIDIDWERPDTAETAAIEGALASLCDPVPEGEPSTRLASGSGPAPVDGTPLVAPSERKRAQSRPSMSMKTVLAGEIDAESELDVPTFIRRHNAVQS